MGARAQCVDNSPEKTVTTSDDRLHAVDVVRLQGAVQRRQGTPERTPRRDRSERDREETFMTFFRYIQGLLVELRIIDVRVFYGSDPDPGGQEWLRWS